MPGAIGQRPHCYLLTAATRISKLRPPRPSRLPDRLGAPADSGPVADSEIAVAGPRRRPLLVPRCELIYRGSGGFRLWAGKGAVPSRPRTECACRRRAFPVPGPALPPSPAAVATTADRRPAAPAPKDRPARWRSMPMRPAGGTADRRSSQRFPATGKMRQMCRPAWVGRRSPVCTTASIASAPNTLISSATPGR